MSKKTLIRRAEQDSLPSSGLNFIYHSYFILCQCVDILSKLDEKKVLSDPKDLQIPQIPNIKDQNMRIKKLFHIDLKHNHIYWEVLKKSKRVILKQSLNTRQTLYEWQFNQTSLGCNQAIQVLGKWKHLELKKSSTQNQEAFKIINFNAINNSFINFEEFYQSVIDLINVKLMEAYDGRILQNFVSNSKREQVHEQLWEYVSIEITRIWKKFEDELQSKKLKQLYQQTLCKDMIRLFNTNSDFQCNQGQTSFPRRQKLIRQLSFIENHYISQNQEILSNQNKDLSFYPVQTNLLFDPQNTTTFPDFMDQSFYKYPHPENYPFVQNYVSQINQDNQTSHLCRKSLKRPANSCHQNCACLQQNGQKCPNLDRKIQCEHHDCLNSRIRQKKGVHCWYIDQEKNFNQISSLKQKLTSSLQIRECHSFGLDFHTVTLLYYLLPFNRIQDCEIIDNEKEKKTIIQVIIPFEVSKTQNLYFAVKKIAYERQYQKYSYEAKILQKKLRWIKHMELQNLKDKLQEKFLTYPKVYEPKCFYKGLGVINSGLKIPTNTLIGQFIGETMPRYRIQQKQELCAKLIRMNNQIKFYCIDAFTHLDEKSEPRFFSVDPQNKGNFCRNLNHSCVPNCKVEVMVSEGKYVLGVYTTREIQQNEELTFDYMSVTDDYEEYKKSVCLCSSLTCRGRYFRYQDQIYTDLDGTFLEKEEPIRKRIKRLIKSSENIQIKPIRSNSKIEYLKKKQINVSFIPEQSKFWFLDWVLQNQKIISNELQYLHRKNINDSATKLRYSICQKSIVYDPKLGQKQKIATLNAKIQKISHYLNKINDFQPPFTHKSHQVLMKKLEYVFENSNFRQKISRINVKRQDLSPLERKIWNLRFNLFQAGSYELNVRKNIDKAFFYFQQAFTFMYVQIHKYPDYKSEPIKIWRQNLSKYVDTVEYFGKDLYVLQNLILWAGQQKKIQKNNKKSHKEERQSSQNLFQKQVQDSFKQAFLLQFDNDFKREFFTKQVKQAILQIQETRFKLKFPEQIKNQSLLSIKTDIQTLKKNLQRWIDRQFILLNCSLKSYKYTQIIKKEQKNRQLVKIQNLEKDVTQVSPQDFISKPQRKKSSKNKNFKQQVKIQY